MTKNELSRLEVRRIATEIFLLGLSGLAIFNAIIYHLPLLNAVDDRVLLIMNSVLGLIFLVDFLYRLIGAESRRDYFLRQYGWADLLSAVPIPAFQFFRIFHSRQIIGELQKIGGRETVRDVAYNRAAGALYVAVWLSLVLVELASLTIVSIESSSPEANIKTAGDAIWWAYVTITTIGYGDHYPVTGPGRFLGALLITVGVALFSVLTGFVANAFLNPQRRLLMGSADRPESDGSIQAEIALVLAELDDVQASLVQQEKNVALISQKLAALDDQLRAMDDSPAAGRG